MQRRAPSWLITSPEAVDTELGVLKTGKEADAFLAERRLGARHHLLAVKRYRDVHHRTFRNDALYRKGRVTGNRRVDLAVAQGTKFGLRARMGLWADREFKVLRVLWEAGTAVPYAIDCNHNELRMEFIGDHAGAAPRLVDAVRGQTLDCEDLWAQCLAGLRAMVGAGIIHGDLSPYNILVWKGRLIFIDMPQAVDIGRNQFDSPLLARDVANVCNFFAAQGVKVDADAAHREVRDEAGRFAADEP